jgi:putative glutamine amidotransferase
LTSGKRDLVQKRTTTALANLKKKRKKEMTSLAAVRPLIGITTAPIANDSEVWGPVHYHRLWNTYTLAVENAGGVPLALPSLTVSLEASVAALVAGLDGVLLSGGGDIRPARYGDMEVHPKTDLMNDDRDAFEIALAKAAIAADVPLLGICRGAQVLNVALGGTLWQDVPSQFAGAIVHRQPDGGTAHVPSHTIQASGLLRDVHGGATEFGVNSFHHQGIKDLAPGLEVVGRAPDGLIEAVCLPGKSFVLAVQYHPEAMCAKDKFHEATFRALMAAAATHHCKRTCPAPVH